MKRAIFYGSLLAAFLAAAAACTISEEEPPTTPEPDDASAPFDGGARDVAIGSDATPDAPGTACSDDGWCHTPLPADDLVLYDVWPFPDRAFALAESYSLGVKILEWSAAEPQWKLIDDNEHNEVGAEYAAKIWAPNPDELYAVVGPGAIVHGKRAGSAWTWSREPLPNPTQPLNTDNVTKRLTIGVWGIGNDLYAWHMNTVFRRNVNDAGAPEWTPEYAVDDIDTPTESIRFMGIAGTSPDDLWLSAIRYERGTCNIVVRRKEGEYLRVADGVLPPNRNAPSCLPRPSAPFVHPSRDLPLQLQTLDGKQFLALNPMKHLVRMTETEDGGLSVELAEVPRNVVERPRWTSLWSESSDRLWLTGGVNGGLSWGIVLQASDAWDAGQYRFSSAAMNGAPLTRLPNQVRGTSGTNVWAVGEGYALHKTTP